LNKFTGAQGAGMGYGRSEQLTASGQIKGRHANLAYKSYGDEASGYRGGLRDLEMQNRDAMMRRLKMQGEITKGGATNALSENEYLKSAAVGEGGIGYSNLPGREIPISPQTDVSVNLSKAVVNVEIKDMNHITDEIVKKLSPVFNQFAQEIVEKISR
jgi:hypothetical protein